MFRWVIHRLASVLPPAIDSDSERMRFSTTQKRLFLRETRFLFFSANGPVEFCLRPAHIVATFSGGMGLVAVFFLSPALPSLYSSSSLPSSISAMKHLTTLFPLPSVLTEQEETVTNWISVFKETFIAPHLTATQNQTSLPQPETLHAQDTGAEQIIKKMADKAKNGKERLGEQEISLLDLRQAMIINPSEYSDIEEPNDELVITSAGLPDHAPIDEARLSVLSRAEQTKNIIALPVARPAPEPMNPEFVSFDGLTNPPIQSPEIKLHRRFANVMSEVDRIEAMLDNLGITPDREPERWNPAFTAADKHVSALYLYRDSWRELLHMLPLQAPLRYYYVTSPYGMRTNKKTGITRFHHGVDLAGTWKAKLRPPASGVVTFAGRDGGFGKVVRVQHAHGIETVYAHLSSVLVSKGSFVTTQDVIGTMGNTGHSDGMHLHYEIRVDGKSKDPEDFFGYGHKLTITGALAGEM